ncbi:hypothetical protein KXD40_001268 [Peronospora effusa]|nr:hypothetical protein KXD40_001268 [Peronospora effusa]
MDDEIPSVIKAIAMAHMLLQLQTFNRTFDAARCEDVFKAFQGRIWKDLIYSCCLNVVENGVKLYKIRMSEGLGTIINTPDLKGVTQALSPAKKVEN